ncbi:protein kinase family protein [Nocardiopsis rhodophaea]|uniref:Protein kinase family protein n=4 Tax=Nocardiopsis rhodophaea TaxID=280238 RepID=A0ABN2S7F4_9ACTN
MIEPGAWLAGRYRLDELVSETSGASFWKATDETLARPVAVWTFTEGFPRTGDVVRAARATSRIADSRVTQVFDADDTAVVPYVVEEWVIGQSLGDLLAQGPMAPDRAAGLVAEAAETLATAHATGLYHLNLTPGKLMWSVGGAVKVTGIGVDAALHGLAPGSPGPVDAQGLGRLLYAALTGHWPDTAAQPGLRPAPMANGAPCPPSQLRPQIPERLNEIVCRSAFQAPMRGAPLTSPREVADALADVPRMVPLPATMASGPAAPPTEQGTSRLSGEFETVAASAPPPPPSRRRPAPADPGGRDGTPGPSPATKVALGVVALLVFVAVVVGAWTIGSSFSGSDNPSADGTSSDGDGTNKDGDEVQLAELKPLSAKGFDPPPGDGGEHDGNAKDAIDGDPSTAWKTEGYNSADFGKLKPGVGLLLDMGDPVELHEVELVLGTAGPANLEILVGDGADLSALDSAASADGVSGEETVKLAEPAKGRYVVVWFTELPQDGKYRGTINEVKLLGKT